MLISKKGQGMCWIEIAEWSSIHTFSIISNSSSRPNNSYSEIHLIAIRDGKLRIVYWVDIDNSSSADVY